MSQEPTFESHLLPWHWAGYLVSLNPIFHPLNGHSNPPSKCQIKERVRGKRLAGRSYLTQGLHFVAEPGLGATSPCSGACPLSCTMFAFSNLVILPTWQDSRYIHYLLRGLEPYTKLFHEPRWASASPSVRWGSRTRWSLGSLHHALLWLQVGWPAVLVCLRLSGSPGQRTSSADQESSSKSRRMYPNSRLPLCEVSTVTFPGTPTST